MANYWSRVVLFSAGARDRARRIGGESRGQPIINESAKMFCNMQILCHDSDSFRSSGGGKHWKG